MFFLLLILNFLAGFGFTTYLDSIQTRAERAGLSILLGMGLHTFVIYLWTVLNIPLTYSGVLGGMIGLILLSHLNIKQSIVAYKHFFTAKWDIRLYEIPFWAVIIYLAYMAIWRAIYLPVTPYDAIVGMDLLAKYAVKEGHLVSSVFTSPNLSGHVQNQLFYAPFTTFSQIITRLGGNHLGQPWLGNLLIGFLLFMYGKMRSYTHPIIAGLFTLLLCLISEYYGYFFLMLTDFSCSVFFGASVVYFYDYYQTKSFKTFILSAILLGFSVWARSDSAIFVAFGLVLVFATHVKENIKDALLKSAIFGAIPFIFFALWNIIMVGYIFPKQPSIDQISDNAYDIGNLLAIYADMITQIMSEDRLWGYTFILFGVLASANILIFRDKKGWEVFAWIVIVFLGLGLIDNIFEAATLENTVKRGLFRMLPLLYLYLSVSSLSIWIKDKISAWEN